MGIEAIFASSVCVAFTLASPTAQRISYILILICCLEASIYLTASSLNTANLDPASLDSVQQFLQSDCELRAQSTTPTSSDTNFQPLLVKLPPVLPQHALKNTTPPPPQPNHTPRLTADALALSLLLLLTPPQEKRP